MGPVCRAESRSLARIAHLHMDDMFASQHADFTITPLGDYLLVEDKGDNGTPVSSDIDNVIAQCLREAPARCKGILFCEHDGVIDAVELDAQDKFVRFVPLYALTRDDALMLAHKHRLRPCATQHYLRLPG